MTALAEHLKDLSDGFIAPEQQAQLIQGWEEYMQAMKIEGDQAQMQEFKAIHRTRLWAGSISLVAPEIPLVLD